MENKENLQTHVINLKTFIDQKMKNLNIFPKNRNS